MPATRDLTIYSGDRYDHRITFQDADEAALDVSGTWRAQIRASPAEAELAAFTIDDTDAATGVLLLSLTAEQTTALRPGLLVWDLENTDHEVTYLSGTVVVARDVSR